MKFFKVHQIEMAAAILFVVLVICFYKEGEDYSAGKGYTEYNDNWKRITEEGDIFYKALPVMFTVSDDKNEVVLRKQLENKPSLSDTIAFFSIHQRIEVYVDNEKIYECAAPKGAKSKTPGKCWNFIELKKEYTGKVLEVRISNCYKGSEVEIPIFYHGEKSTIIVGQMKEHIAALLFSIIMLMAGIFTAGAWRVSKNRMYLHKGLLWLGIFTIHLAVWSAVETQVLQLMLGRNLLFSQCAFMSLKLMVFPMIRYVQSVYHMENSRVMNFFAGISILDFTFSFISQIFGWFDYKQTIWITHILFTAAAVVTLYGSYRLLTQKREKQMRDKHLIVINAVCICMIMAGIIINSSNYHTGLYNNIAVFTRISWLVYIVTLAVQFLSNSFRLMQAGEQIETIKEEARLDGLTRLKNRACFEQDLNNIKSSQYRKYSMVMFDLNNLKKMNDMYGHGMGDCYIITSSEIIRDVFGEFGNIYRIGGDEFCLVSKAITQKEYLLQEERMCNWIKSLKGTQVRGFMQIASGYAKFNISRDNNLMDTLEFADERMYQRKKEQKQMV